MAATTDARTQDADTNAREHLDKARRTHRRVNLYAWLGAGVCVGLAVTLGLGFNNVTGPGLFSLGTAMAMVGGALAVLSIGLVAALFSARSALSALESYCERLALEASRHADGLFAAQAARSATVERALRGVSVAESQHAAALRALREEAERDHGMLVAVERRMADAARSTGQDIADLRYSDTQLAGRIAGDEAEARRTVEELRAQLGTARAGISRVMAEERERKEEFEALAAEEIRLMGRVRRAESYVKGEPERMGEYYRISRPKATHRGPFGEVYPIAEVDGIAAARAERLREFGIANTEHLWRANPTFIAALLHCDAKDVECWQEEAELMAVNGIGRERAKALVDAGITSIEKLGTQEPAHVVQLVHRAGRGDGAGITEANAAKWIESAHRMRPAA